MSASETFGGLKVMVIDDSNTIRRSAEIFLGKTGAKVVLAEDGFDALAKIADHQPDLIFCDVLMPRLDGYQTCALIKKSPKFKSTPVVMLSSKDGLFDKAKGRMVGSDHYLTKPFTKDSLLKAVSEFVRRPAAAGATSGRPSVSNSGSLSSSPASSPSLSPPATHPVGLSLSPSLTHAVAPMAPTKASETPMAVGDALAQAPALSSMQNLDLDAGLAFSLDLRPEFLDAAQAIASEPSTLSADTFTLSLV